MRTLTIVCLIAVMLSMATVSPALADRSRGGKTNWVALGLAAVVLLLTKDSGSGSTAYQTPQAYAPAPEPLWRAQRNLGNLLLKEAAGSRSTPWVASQVLGTAGWTVIDERARRAALDEQRRYGGTGEVAAANYFAYIRAEFKQGSAYDRGQRTRSSSSSSRGREIVCTVHLVIADGAGNTYQAQGIGSNFSRYDSFNWRSCNYSSSQREYTPSDGDLALLAAMVAASNQASSQAYMAAVPPIYSDVPTNGIGNAGTLQPTVSAQPHCPYCGEAIVVTGARYCTKCGKELPH